MVGENEMMFVQECNEKTEEVCQEVSETRCQVGGLPGCKAGFQAARWVEQFY